METIYSLSSNVPADLGRLAGDEAASSPGALTAGSVRSACLVRKISAGGAVLDCDDAVEIGQRLELALMSGQHLAGHVAWRRAGEVGLAFDTQVDVFALIAQDIVNQPGDRRRMPRVELVCEALLEGDGRIELVTVHDIAQGGVKIDTPVQLEPERRLSITIEGLRPLDAIVRWSRDHVAGIAFVPELSWQELMLWLKERRRTLSVEGSAPFAPPHDPVAEPVSTADQQTMALNLPARVREGSRRWAIDVVSITPWSVAFDTFAALNLGSLLWVSLPGLEGWPARIVTIDGYRFTCEFTQPLHPAVLERILALAPAEGR